MIESQQQINSLLLTQHRLAEVINATANRLVVSSSYKDGHLDVSVVDEPEPLGAIDGANLQ